jgi:hypothetical protein
MVNLNYSERKSLIDGIILSDCNYLEKLLNRKMELLREFESLELMISKKVAEIEGMRLQQKIAESLQ